VSHGTRSSRNFCSATLLTGESDCVNNFGACFFICVEMKVGQIVEPGAVQCADALSKTALQRLSASSSKAALERKMQAGNGQRRRAYKDDWT
jgi:hypothetical protein